LDWSVGEVLGTLDQLGLAGKTLLVFSSDNGGVAGRKPVDHAEINGYRVNGPLRGQKTEVYEGGHREPFIVRWPGRVQAGATSHALVANTDLMATFAELVNRKLPADAGEDSFSFLSVLLGKTSGWPARSSLVTDSMLGLFAIQQGPWKLIQGQGGGGFYPQNTTNPDTIPPAGAPAGQLYNLADDIGETRNLYTEQPHIVARLTALLEKIKQDGRSRP